MHSHQVAKQQKEEGGSPGTITEHMQEAKRQRFISTALASKSLLVQGRVAEGSRVRKFRCSPTIPSHNGKTTRHEGVPASLPRWSSS